MTCVRPNEGIAFYPMVVNVTRTAPGSSISHPAGVYDYLTSDWGTGGMSVDIDWLWDDGEGSKTLAWSGPCGKTVVTTTTTLP